MCLLRHGIVLSALWEHCSKYRAATHHSFGSFILKTYDKKDENGEKFRDPPGYDWRSVSDSFKFRDISRASAPSTHCTGLSVLKFYGKSSAQLK